MLKTFAAVFLFSAVIFSAGCVNVSVEKTPDTGQIYETLAVTETADTGQTLNTTAEDTVKTESGTETVLPPGDFTEDPDAMETAAASVVKLEAYDSSDSRIATGSGFVMFGSEYLVTAYHNVVNMEYMIATKDDGETFRTDRLIGADKNSDVAVCLITEDEGLSPLEYAGTAPPRGEKAAVIGTQLGVVNMITTGNVCGIWNSDDVGWILFSAPVSKGSSGAPVLNSCGEVIGMVSGTYDEGQNMNLATPVTSIISVYENIMEDGK